MSLSKPCKNPYQNTYRRFFHESKKNLYLKQLKENLNETDLDKLDPNSLMDRVLLCIKDAIHSTFPLRKVSRKEAKKIQNPWMTKEILKEQKIRDQFKKNWITSGHAENSPQHLNYKTSRNKVVKMIRKT